MTPGSIFFDTDFKFMDGEKGEKLFVILNDGSCGFYLAVKTTTNPKYKGRNEGCQIGDRDPNFYLPYKSCDFKEETWIQLSDFFEFKRDELLAKSFKKIVVHKGDLTRDIVVELLECAVSSDDLSGKQRPILEEMFRSL
jgi:hypothetical protein